MESTTKTAQTDLVAALDKLWTRFLPDIRERVAVVESAVESLRKGLLSTGQREAAASAAHKLAGVLGTFNLDRGTVLARELELIFSGADSLDPASADRLDAMAAELRSVIESRK
jgi:HPt (histidine-containing phosphotransfer) domain-containing protein